MCATAYDESNKYLWVYALSICRELLKFYQFEQTFFTSIFFFFLSSEDESKRKAEKFIPYQAVCKQDWIPECLMMELFCGNLNENFITKLYPFSSHFFFRWKLKASISSAKLFLSPSNPVSIPSLNSRCGRNEKSQ